MVESPEIKILIFEEEDILRIDVINNGIGLTSEEFDHLRQQITTTYSLEEERSFGLKNVYERIQRYYGDGYGLSLIRLGQHEGFGVTMKLPLQRKERS